MIILAFFQDRWAYWGSIASVLGLLFAIWAYFYPPGDSNDIRKTSHPGSTVPKVETPTANSDEAALRFRIEGLLVELGYLNGVPSGEATLDSREAIRQAEIELGLSVDGKPDLALMRVLQSRKDGS